MGVSGRRYYSPSQGRFLGRDTIEEQGGLNLYGFVRNDGVNKWDVLGMGEMEGWQYITIQNADGSWSISKGGSAPTGWDVVDAGIAGANNQNWMNYASQAMADILPSVNFTSTIAPNNAGGLASTNSNGLWVPNGLNDLLHGQPVLPGLPTAVPGGTFLVNVNPQPDIGGTGDRSGMKLTATYYNNSNQTYNWSQVVTTDTLPHPGGTTPYSDSLPGAVLGAFYPSSALPKQNPSGAAVFVDRPFDTGPGSFSATTQPFAPSNLSQGSPFTISWGFTVTAPNGGRVVTPAPITVYWPPHP